MKEYNEQVVETLDDAGCIIANKNIIIDNLQARVAELEAENARLKKVTHVSLPTNTMEQWVASEIRRATSHIKEQLAASQLSNQQLREALETYIDEHEECQDADDWMAMMCSIEAHHVADKALSQPTPTEALDAYVAEKVKISRDIDEKQIAYLFEERSLLTRQRDLAVEALEDCKIYIQDTGQPLHIYRRVADTLYAIKESEVK